MNSYIKDFVRYLKQNGLYSQFRNNFYFFEKDKEHFTSPLWKKLRKQVFYKNGNYPLATFMHYGFIWCFTPEDDEFWSKIEKQIEKQTNRKWDDYEKKTYNLREFIRYIKSKGIYPQFIKNFTKEKTNNSLWKRNRNFVFYGDRRHKYTLPTFFNFCFMWETSIEGFEYWYSIYKNAVEETNTNQINYL